MSWFGRLKAGVISKNSTILLSGILTLSGSFLEASSMPVPLGPPERLSPIPGPANPDPILQNLVLVMDNHYQPPYYPGGAPDYLSQIYYISNYYITNLMNFNPCNDKIMHVSFGQNFILDLTGTFYPFTIGSNAYATSFDRGRTWNLGPPIEQIIPLGGDISQIVNTSLGPGLINFYGKNGKLYAAGWAGFDMIANPPATNPQANLLLTTSDDNGKTWDNPKIFLSSNIDFWWLPSQNGVGPFEFYITPQPSNPEFIHSTTFFPLYANASTLLSNLFYRRSKDGGETFEPYRQVYSMINDPVWRSKYFDPNFPFAIYFIYGGFLLSSGYPIQFDDNTLLLPIQRRLPQTEFQVIHADQAIVKSLDNGNTFSKIAGATEQYLSVVGVHDPGFTNPNAGQIVNGVLSFPFFQDVTFQWGTPLVSPVTGRLYLTYEAIDPLLSDFSTGDLIDHVLLSVSADKGDTFFPAVQINQTPKNISAGAQQAFAHNAVITQDGYYVLAYYDFRNWTGFPGESIETTPLPTDAWLDVFRETEDPRGGSTGVGLDFVGEYRLTKDSFDARIINLNTSIPYLTPFITLTPQGIGLTVNNNNELFVVFSTQSSEGVSPANISLGYRGMTIDQNPYMTSFLQRFKFANVSNQ